MPRASLESNKVLQQGFGIQEGKVEIADARFKIIQRQKKDGTLITPMFVLQLDCLKLDDKWDRIDETVEQTELLLGWGSKETGEDGNHKFRFRPGNAKGPDDVDPEDLGPVINTEGNSFYCEQEGDMPYADADAMIFMKSLEAKGWKTEINAQGYAPNYKGAKFEIKSVLKTDLCKRYGIKYSPTSPDQEKATVWEVIALHTRPYEKKGGTATKPAGKPVAGKPASTGTASGANGAAKDGFMDESLDRTQVALTLLKEPSQQFSDAVKGDKGVKRDAFQKAFTMELMRRKVHPKIQTDLKKMMVEDDVLSEWGAEVGFMVDVEAKTVTFVSE